VVRNGNRRSRRLVVGDRTFLWSVSHEHRLEADPAQALVRRYRDCTEILSLRLDGTTGRLLIAFAEGAGRIVSDGLLPAGMVGTAAGARLNLHEPGTVRSLLDEAVARGWTAETASATTSTRLDGWTLFDAVAARRRSPTT
jgi:hypothetical protein